MQCLLSIDFGGFLYYNEAIIVIGSVLPHFGIEPGGLS